MPYRGAVRRFGGFVLNDTVLGDVDGDGRSDIRARVITRIDRIIPVVRAYEVTGAVFHSVQMPRLAAVPDGDDAYTPIVGDLIFTLVARGRSSRIAR